MHTCLCYPINDICCAKRQKHPFFSMLEPNAALPLDNGCDRPVTRSQTGTLRLRRVRDRRDSIGCGPDHGPTISTDLHSSGGGSSSDGDDNDDANDGDYHQRRATRSRGRRAASSSTCSASAAIASTAAGAVPTCVEVHRLPLLLERLMRYIAQHGGDGSDSGDNGNGTGSAVDRYNKYAIETLLLNCAMDTSSFANEDELFAFVAKSVVCNERFMVMRAQATATATATAGVRAQQSRGSNSRSTKRHKIGVHQHQQHCIHTHITTSTTSSSSCISSNNGGCCAHLSTQQRQERLVAHALQHGTPPPPRPSYNEAHDVKVVRAYHELMDSEDMKKLRSYRDDAAPVLTEDEWRRFEEAYRRYPDSNRSNRRIAKLLDNPKIHPNHVSLYKRLYKRRLEQERRRDDKQFKHSNS